MSLCIRLVCSHGLNVLLNINSNQLLIEPNKQTKQIIAKRITSLSTNFIVHLVCLTQILTLLVGLTNFPPINSLLTRLKIYFRLQFTYHLPPIKNPTRYLHQPLLHSTNCHRHRLRLRHYSKIIINFNCFINLLLPHYLIYFMRGSRFKKGLHFKKH